MLEKILRNNLFTIEELQILDELSKDVKRLDWLEKNRAEILIHYDNMFDHGNNKTYYAIIWDSLKKEVVGETLREVIDKAMDKI